MKDFLSALLLFIGFACGALTLNWYHHGSLQCAQAVLHQGVAKCAVYIDKEVLR